MLRSWRSAGEENTRRHYEQAPRGDLPKIRVLLEQQKPAVEEALLELRPLEPARRAG